MKPATLTVVALLLCITAPVYAGINVNIDIPGPPGIVVAPPPPPVVVAPPVEEQPEIVIEQPPQLIYSPALGFYVAVGTPFNMVLIDNNYYVYRGGRWFMSPTYDGGWVLAQPRYLPSGIRRHNWEYIRGYRDREYAAYRRDPQHYHGRFYEHHAGERRGEHRGEMHGDHRVDQRGGHRVDQRIDRRGNVNPGLRPAGHQQIQGAKPAQVKNNAPAKHEGSKHEKDNR